MLRPTKHLNLDLSVLNVAALMLRVLHRARVVSYDELYRKLHKRLGDDLRLVFLPALNFLYLLGKVEYHEKSDSFEFLERGRDGQ